MEGTVGRIRALCEGGGCKAGKRTLKACGDPSWEGCHDRQEPNGKKVRGRVTRHRGAVVRYEKRLGTSRRLRSWEVWVEVDELFQKLTRRERAWWGAGKGLHHSERRGFHNGASDGRTLLYTRDHKEWEGGGRGKEEKVGG